MLGGDALPISFREEVRRALPLALTLPEPIGLMLDWIEEKALLLYDSEGQRYGVLQIIENAGRGKDESPRVTWPTFEPARHETSRYWFALESSEITERLSVFATTGGDGSIAAFWLAPCGRQKIVHMGSGSGSTLACVLAHDPVDFLRLSAIGYDELCWPEDFDYPPYERPGDHFGPRNPPNVGFQNWVRETFDVTIPRTASEIIMHPAEMEDDDSSDPFWRWTKEAMGDPLG